MDINGLSRFASNALDMAVTEAKKSGADALNLAHLFLGLMDESAGASCIAVSCTGLERDIFRHAMNRRLGTYTTKYDNQIGLTRATVRVFEVAQQIAEGNVVDSDHLLLALLRMGGEIGSELKEVLREIGFPLSDLKSQIEIFLMSQQPRERQSETIGSTAERQRKSRAADRSSTQNSHSALPPMLGRYGKDLTSLAVSGRLDPMIGRDVELQRTIRTLLRRRKNNPCLIGKAGVGKTAIVEGLAQLIADGKAPASLQGARIIELNMGVLLSGTKFRGEFEERVTGIIEEASEDSRFILFFDEIHTILDSGASESGVSAANILKPALSRGAISVIGATTTEEYRKYIEKDAALERRFQSVMVDEPSVEQTIAILYNLRGRYEDHHGLTIEDDAIRAAAELSAQYINGRQLPDKAVDVLDEAASKLRLQDRYQMFRNDVAAVIAETTGIPVGNITEDEGKRLVSLEEKLHARVVGQGDAVSAVARAIRRNRAGLKDASRPVGSFLFLGPTGVGKTELSLALSEALYLQKKALIRLDMSEFLESHSAAKILGAPPGYVGYDTGSTLTEKVSRMPYCVLLFDEIEKAHPDIWNLLLQILDVGTLTDATGREVSFKNVTVIVTSNIGANHMVTPIKSLGFVSSENTELPREKVFAELKNTFMPELLNRFDEIILFNKLTLDDTVKIAAKMAADAATKADNAGITLTFTENAIRALAEKGYDPAYGARPLHRVIQKEVEDSLANLMLGSEATFGDCVECDYNGKFTFRVKKPALTT